MRRGIRLPKWWMLLVGILVAILSNECSLVSMERFATRHRQTLNDLLGTDFVKPPSDSTFRLLLAQLEVAGFEAMLRDWMAAQPGVAEGLDTLVCVALGLPRSGWQDAAGLHRRNRLWRSAFYRPGEPVLPDAWLSRSPRPPKPPMPLVRSRHCAAAGGGRTRRVLMQADALHANRPFSSTSPSAAPTFCRRQSSA